MILNFCYLEKSCQCVAIKLSISFQAVTAPLLSNNVFAIFNTRYGSFYGQRCVSSLSGENTPKVKRPLRVEDSKDTCKSKCIKIQGFFSWYLVCYYFINCKKPQQFNHWKGTLMSLTLEPSILFYCS